MAPDRVALRLTDFDSRMMAIVAANVRAQHQTPFVTPADAIRASLRMAAEAIMRANGAVAGGSPNAA